MANRTRRQCGTPGGAFTLRGQWLGAALLLISLLPVTPGARAGGVPVTVTLAREMPIRQEIRVTGTVTSKQSARLSVATGGLVQAIRVEEGSAVSAGDPLLELDPELAQLQWEAARAGAEQARLALADARRRLQEAQTLAPQRSIAETVVRDLAAEAAEDEASLARAEAQAGYQQALLERHTLRAPFGGVISAKLTEVGQWVDPGQAVLDLVAIGDLRLDFAVAEDFLPRLTPDTEVEFRLSAEPEQRYRGTVATVVPVADPGARTFLLRVHCERCPDTLAPGMSVVATLRLQTDRVGVAVLRDATLRYPDGRVVVWSVAAGEDGPVAREHLVRTGQAFDGLVEIVDGLVAGQTVVVRGNEALQNGQRLLVTAED